MALGLPSDPAQQKRLLVGILPLVLVFLYWYLLHGDYATEVETMRTRVENLQSQNEIARIQSMQAGRLTERLERFERHVARLEELVPRNEEVSQLLNQINEGATQVGVEVAVFRPGQTGRGTHYNRRTFEMTVYGTYHNITEFLTRIGSLPRIITPMNLSLESRGERDRAGGERLQASFEVETYVLPENAARAAGGTPGA